MGSSIFTAVAGSKARNASGISAVKKEEPVLMLTIDFIILTMAFSDCPLFHVVSLLKLLKKIQITRIKNQPKEKYWIFFFNLMNRLISHNRPENKSIEAQNENRLTMVVNDKLEETAFFESSLSRKSE